MQHTLRDQHPPLRCSRLACAALPRGRPAAQGLHKHAALDAKHWRSSAANRSVRRACASTGPCSCAASMPRGRGGPLAARSTCSKPRRPPTPAAQTARRIALLRTEPQELAGGCGWAARPRLRQRWKDGCWGERFVARARRSRGLKARVARSALRRWWPRLRRETPAPTSAELFSPQDRLQSACRSDRAGALGRSSRAGDRQLAPAIQGLQTVDQLVAQQRIAAPGRRRPIRLSIRRRQQAHRSPAPAAGEERGRPRAQSMQALAHCPTRLARVLQADCPSVPAGPARSAGDHTGGASPTACRCSLRRCQAAWRQTGAEKPSNS